MAEAEERTRGQRILDAVIVGAAGTIAAAVVISAITGAWSIYTSVHRVETMQKAMNLVITEKLARMDSDRIDMLDKEIQRLQEQRRQDMEQFAKSLLDTVDDDDPEAIKRFLSQYLSSDDKPQPQGHDQNQDPPAKQEPDWRQFERRRRNTQDQIQQQYEILK